MSTPKRSALLELAALVAISGLLVLVSAVIVLNGIVLVQGRGLDFTAFMSQVFIVFLIAPFYWIVCCLASLAIIWYLRRGFERPYRYWDGVLLGMVCYLLPATVFLVVDLVSATSAPLYGWEFTLLVVYGIGGLFALPAVFSVGPLALWLWHKVIARLRR